MPPINPIVVEARTWLRTPFHHQARIKGVGVDCAGVVKETAKACGKHYADLDGYGRVPTGGQLRRFLDQHADRISVSEIHPGDFFLMKFRRNPQHLAIWTGNTIIHAWEGAGACVEHAMDTVWRKRIVCAYRMRDHG